MPNQTRHGCMGQNLEYPSAVALLMFDASYATFVMFVHRIYSTKTGWWLTHPSEIYESQIGS